MRLLHCLPLALLLGSVRLAAAQGLASVEQYRPVAPANRGFEVETLRFLPHLQYAAALDLSYAHLPLRLTEPGSSHDVLEHAAGGTALLGIGLYGRFELDLALPFVAYQAGDTPPGAPAPGAAGLGDARLALRARVWHSPGGAFALGAALLASTPMAPRRVLLNERTPGVEPRLVAEYSARRWIVAGHLGLGLRGQTDLYGTKLGQLVTVGTGAQYGLRAATRLVGELTGATAADGHFLERRHTPVELLLGARQQVGLMSFGLGGGPGLVSGYGAPAFRVVATVGWASVGPDFDRDGVADVGDACPWDAEDRDDFEDADGCPDPDNDGDGLLDGVDQCPNQAETKNGFQDEDGCPDNLPAPGDRDGDGIPDQDDKCPDEPEDKDGFEDADGCPDPDNDKDGILDKDDKCPNQPETINGNADEDGCPDEGKVQVQVGEKELLIDDRVFFDTERARVKSASQSLLNQVAHTLRAHPEIGRCAVEGHADDTGPDDYNQKLSLRRALAVVDYLVGRGIARARLSPIGQGERLPWVDNGSPEGRAKNRRVVFHIEGAAAVEAATKRRRARPPVPRAEKAEKAETVERVEKVETVEKIPKADEVPKVDKVDRPEKVEGRSQKTEPRLAPKPAPAKTDPNSLRDLIKLPPK